MTTGRINQVAIPSKIPNQGAGATARARAIVPAHLRSSPSLQVIPPPGLLRPQSAIRGRARKPRVTSFRRCRPIGASSDGIQGPTASEPPLGTADSPRREGELGAKCPSKKCVPSSRRRTAAARCRAARPRAPCAPPKRGQMVYLRSFFPDRGREPDLGQ